MPHFVQGRSLTAGVKSGEAQGRQYVISSIPFANPDEPVHSADNLLRPLSDYPITTVTSGDRSRLDSPAEGSSELYHLASDPGQLTNLIVTRGDVTRELHQFLVRFMRETHVPDRLLQPRLEPRSRPEERWASVNATVSLQPATLVSRVVTATEINMLGILDSEPWRMVNQR